MYLRVLIDGRYTTKFYRLIEVDGARPQFDYMRRLEGAPSERESPGERKFEASDLEPKAKAKM